MHSFTENHKPMTNANHLMAKVINQDRGGHIRTEMVKKANTRRTLKRAKGNKLNKSIANGFLFSF